MNPKTIVLNWHVTEACNYHCHYCFSKWNKPVEIWGNKLDIEKVVSNIRSHFINQGIFAIRLNIVGGEPTLFPERLWNVVETAYTHNIEVSIITNGSHLENIRPFVHMISQVGISIDSLNHETCMNIGRECRGKAVSLEEIRQKIEDLCKVNPALTIKLNTVVNEHNFNEILVNDFAKLNIDKWKILRQRPFNGNPGISDYQFYAFLRNNYNEEPMRKSTTNHESISFSMADLTSEQILQSYSQQVIFVEDKDVMTESYLMISPDGRMFQNGSEEYTYSHPLTEVPFAEALSEIKFNRELFDERYNSGLTTFAIQNMESFFHIYEDTYDDFDCYTDFSDD